MKKKLAALAVVLVLVVSGISWTEPDIAPNEPASAVVERVCSSTAFVQTDLNGVEEGSGSGVIISTGPNTTWVVTCDHVVENCNGFSVTFGRSGKAFPCTVDKRLDKSRGDVALLRIAQNVGLPAIRLAPRLPVRGSVVFACGSPYAYRDLVSYGRVAAYEPRTFEGLTFGSIVMSMNIGPGMSGGPVCNAQGDIVGLVRTVFRNGSFSSCTTSENIRQFMGWKP